MNNNSAFFEIFRKLFVFGTKSIPVLNNWNLKRLLKKGKIIPEGDLEKYLNDASEVIVPSLHKEIYVGLVKKKEDPAFKGYIVKRDDWPKYERFLRINNINYSFYDISSSEWLNEAGKFNIIIWRPDSSPVALDEAKAKIFFLEKYLKKKCFPPFEEIWSYEDKVKAYYLYTHFNLPAVPTFITNSGDEALEFLEKTTFPLISKITTGSASYGITKLNNRKSAIKYVRKCFSDKGRKTYWPYLRQKNYVYFQKFVEDSRYDLRIILAGGRIFGYYRFPRAGDFRASGAGIVRKMALPEEAMSLALRVRDLFKSNSLTVDMVYSENEKKYYIIETSIFCGIDTAAQLAVDGIAGFYEYSDCKFTFKEGRFWIQELALRDFFTQLFSDTAESV